MKRLLWSSVEGGPLELFASDRVDEALPDYTVRLIRQTRSSELLRRGASIRSAIAILKGARVLAALEGRDYVIPDDVKKLALPALRHRVELSADARIADQNVEGVLRKIFSEVGLP